ncbi:MAG: thioredoxin fold domain-containing protein [Gammaproteobacteria bacterium]|nr:thioredoxin fold domain-containing protein [Gammaproteobacteria bacterium]
MNTTFTPSMLFYNTHGKLALRLPGFRPPYQFRAALEYVADSHYQREKFADYLARAEAAMEFGQDKMNENDAFTTAPYNFDRSRIPGKRPLVIFFEHPRCHACDVLHADPISNKNVAARLSKFDAAQLNIFSDVPVITPDGQKTTAKAWARQLDLSFAPALIFFDEQGKEIIRIDSVVRLYRLNNVLNYVLSKGYLKYPTLQSWQQNTRH